MQYCKETKGNQTENQQIYSQKTQKTPNSTNNNNKKKQKKNVSHVRPEIAKSQP